MALLKSYAAAAKSGLTAFPNTPLYKLRPKFQVSDCRFYSTPLAEKPSFLLPHVATVLEGEHPVSEFKRR